MFGTGVPPMKTTAPLLAVLALCASLCGCAGSSVEIARRSPSGLVATDQMDIARALGDLRKMSGGTGTSDITRLRDELRRRGVVPEQAWPHIDRGQPAIGMGQTPVLAALGTPIATLPDSTREDGTVVSAWKFARLSGNDVVVWFSNSKVISVEGMAVTTMGDTSETHDHPRASR